MKSFIIDDEPRALDILEAYIEKASFLKLSGRFRDPVQATSAILSEKPDLIFLDINMPGINGIQLLKSLKNPPLVVFTTAYSEFAIESYELDAVDYLLKPIEFERFLKAAIKAKELFDLKNKTGATVVISKEEPADHAVFIKSGTKTHRIEISSILFIEAMGNYVNFVLTDKKICAYMSLQDAVALLPEQQFMRIHKSYVISKKHIDTLEVHQVKIKEHVIPIGKNFRDGFDSFKG